MKKIWLLIFCLAFAASAAHAETIYFKNGKVLEADISMRTSVFIRIRSSYGVTEKEFLLENIQRIEGNKGNIMSRKLPTNVQEESSSQTEKELDVEEPRRIDPKVLVQEAVQRKIAEAKLSSTRDVIPEVILEEPVEQKVDLEAESVSLDEIFSDVITEEEKEEFFAEEPVPDLKETADTVDGESEEDSESAGEEGSEESSEFTFESFLMSMKLQDYGILGICIALLIFLLLQQKRGASGLNKFDVSVSASLTYQALSEEAKKRITSNDITLVLQLQAQFQETIGLGKERKKPLVVEDEQVLSYIQEKSKQLGHAFKKEDIKLILDTYESSQA